MKEGVLAEIRGADIVKGDLAVVRRVRQVVRARIRERTRDVRGGRDPDIRVDGLILEPALNPQSAEPDETGDLALVPERDLVGLRTPQVRVDRVRSWCEGVEGVVVVLVFVEEAVAVQVAQPPVRRNAEG